VVQYAGLVSNVVIKH